MVLFNPVPLLCCVFPPRPNTTELEGGRGRWEDAGGLGVWEGQEAATVCLFVHVCPLPDSFPPLFDSLVVVQAGPSTTTTSTTTTTTVITIAVPNTTSEHSPVPPAPNCPQPLPLPPPTPPDWVRFL
ncbi:hypothetical protein E2C01_081182 [Portunus trituberculatus]|uniref:Uncharacterized protein n=1 Tax=Portunus trituberculatus TaxID=210409 RepID=A0A5B7IXZ9_PORTR|nr:hypothetical protein [Portunus trituberculatus]